MKKIILIFAVTLISCSKQEMNVSKLFLDFKENPATALLPDYSWAGYRFGEEAIPEVEGRIFNVTDYGAIPDDDLEDFDGVQSAIHAAEQAGGGIVFFPSGRFLMNEMEGRRAGIVVGKPGIVLKGSGSGEYGTELFVRNYMLPRDPTKPWTVPTLFTFRTESGTVEIGTLTENSNKRSFVLHLSSAEGLAAGDFITLNMQNPTANADFLAGLDTWDNWTETNEQGVKIYELHRVKSIKGNEVTLCEPLHTDMRAEYGFTVKKLPMSSGWAVEDLWFHGNFTEFLNHHRDFVHDAGWGCLRMEKMQNGWIRRVRYTNVTNGALLTNAYASSIINVQFDGNPGHTSVGAENSYGVLLGCIEDNTDDPGIWHGPSFANSTNGCVVWRYRGKARSGPDFHASWPYCNLVDASESRYIGNGGNVRKLPNHLTGLTYWNHKEIGGYQNIDFWEPQQYKDSPVKQYLEYGKFAKLVLPNLIGFHGGTSTFNKAALNVNESFGKPVWPESLYEAQLELRLGTLPEWVGQAKAELSR